MLVERWFPAKDSQKVVGMFADAEVVDKKKSEEARKNVYTTCPVLVTKIAGSADTSTQRVKDFNKKELIDRFPGAWDHYEETRQDQEDKKPEPVVIEAHKGTPLDKADFLPRAKLPWLTQLGFSTVEQIADMSDAQCQDLGRGAQSWRKKAQEFLKRT